MKITINSTMLGLLAASALIASGCTNETRVVDPVVTNPAPVDLSQYNDQYEACPKVTNKAVLECRQQNGVMQREGMMGCYMCVVTFIDAGKSCHDESDCEGSCRAKQDQFANAGTANQTGVCQKNSSPFGCYQNIKNGVLQPALCVD